jgi:hypothetical protein
MPFSNLRHASGVASDHRDDGRPDTAALRVVGTRLWQTRKSRSRALVLRKIYDATIVSAGEAWRIRAARLRPLESVIYADPHLVHVEPGLEAGIDRAAAVEMLGNDTAPGLQNGRPGGSVDGSGTEKAGTVTPPLTLSPRTPSRRPHRRAGDRARRRAVRPPSRRRCRCLGPLRREAQLRDRDGRVCQARRSRHRPRPDHNAVPEHRIVADGASLVTPPSEVRTLTADRERLAAEPASGPGRTDIRPAPVGRGRRCDRERGSRGASPNRRSAAFAVVSGGTRADIAAKSE